MEKRKSEITALNKVGKKDTKVYRKPGYWTPQSGLSSDCSSWAWCECAKLSLIYLLISASLKIKF